MKRFFNLKFGDKFDVNDIVYQKEGFFSAVRSLGTREDWPGDALLYLYFWPWQKVQLELSSFQKLLRKHAKEFNQLIARTLAASSPFLDLMETGTFPKGRRSRIKTTLNGKRNRPPTDFGSLTAGEPYTPEQLMKTPYTGPNVFSSPPTLGERDPSRAEVSISPEGHLRIGKVKAPLSELKALYRRELTEDEAAYKDDNRSGPSA